VTSLHVRIQHAFDRATLDVDVTLGGGMTALLGPSGIGKTRTLDVIAGLLVPAQGLVVIDDEVLTDTARGIMVPPHRRRIGYVFQDSRLFPHLTVRQNLEYGRWFAARRGEPRAALDPIVGLLDLEPLLARHPNRLSGGERRRVALGRALLSNPRLLLLDEPLGSLEVSKRQEVLPYLDSLMRDVHLPIIYVTHDWDEVEGRAARIVRMDAPREHMRSDIVGR
jgi:molybdate transport system ATP-binding protein